MRSGREILASRERWKLAERDDALAPLWKRLRERWSQFQFKIAQEVEAELPSDGRLEIVSLPDTGEAELDIKLRNASEDSVYITVIKVSILRECVFCLPILRPTAIYSLPIGTLKAGESKELAVSHIISPHSADRFLVALDTPRVLQLRLTLGYDRHWSISENFWFWDHTRHFRKSYAQESIGLMHKKRLGKVIASSRNSVSGSEINPTRSRIFRRALSYRNCTWLSDRQFELKAPISYYIFMTAPVQQIKVRVEELMVQQLPGPRLVTHAKPFGRRPNALR